MKNTGFSLVELSIVLVILGLLTGGILAGQNLIRAAELRSVSTQVQSYTAATQTFRDKYFAVPGDMRNATAFWGKNNTACSSHTGTATTNGTCNGDGDGNVELAGAANATSEMMQFWHQLALAGLMEGSYTGLTGATTSNWGEVVIGTNVPKARLGTAGWSAFNLNGPTNPTFAGSGEMFVIDYGNAFMMGAYRAAYFTMNPIITPEEAWNIDTKMDDGQPARGSVIGIHFNNLCSVANTGSNTNVNFDASYKLTDTAQRCSLIFRNAF